MATRITPTPQRGTFGRGLRVQGKVIGAILMRELHTRYGRENIGYIWLILEPMMLAVMIAIIHTRTSAHFTSDIRPVPFALIGYCNFMTFRSIFGRAEGALEGNLPLLYHRTVSIFDILLARGLLEWAGTMMSFLILMGLAISAGLATWPVRPLYVLLGMGLMFVFSFGLSLIVCAITFDRPAIGRLIHPLTYIMMPLSGVFLAMQWIPAQYRSFLTYFPLSHIFEIMRYGQFRSSVPYFIDGWYLGVWIVVSMLVGLLAVSSIRGKIHMS